MIYPVAVVKSPEQIISCTSIYSLISPKLGHVQPSSESKPLSSLQLPDHPPFSSSILYFFNLTTILLLHHSRPPDLFTVFAAPLTDPRTHPPAAPKISCLCLLFAAVPSATAVRPRKPQGVSTSFCSFLPSHVHTYRHWISYTPPLASGSFSFLYNTMLSRIHLKCVANAPSTLYDSVPCF